MAEANLYRRTSAAAVDGVLKDFRRSLQWQTAVIAAMGAILGAAIGFGLPKLWEMSDRISASNQAITESRDATAQLAVELKAGLQQLTDKIGGLTGEIAASSRENGEKLTLLTNAINQRVGDLVTTTGSQLAQVTAQLEETNRQIAAAADRSAAARSRIDALEAKIGELERDRTSQTDDKALNARIAAAILSGQRAMVSLDLRGRRIIGSDGEALGEIASVSFKPDTVAIDSYVVRPADGSAEVTVGADLVATAPDGGLMAKTLSRRDIPNLPPAPPHGAT